MLLHLRVGINVPSWLQLALSCNIRLLGEFSWCTELLFSSYLSSWITISAFSFSRIPLDLLLLHIILLLLCLSPTPPLLLCLSINWSRQMAAHSEPGSAWGFCLLKRKLFFAIVELFSLIFECRFSLQLLIKSTDIKSSGAPYIKSHETTSDVIWCYFNKYWIELSYFFCHLFNDFHLSPTLLMLKLLLGRTSGKDLSQSWAVIFVGFVVIVQSCDWIKYQWYEEFMGICWI